MFRPSGLFVLLAASLGATACKSKPQDPPPAPTAAAAPAASATQPAEPPAVADDTLSVAQPEKGQCAWVRLEGAKGGRQVLFTFEGPCESAWFAWSPDGRQGAVLQSFAGTRAPLAWKVDLLAGQGVALPLPEVGRTTELGFDPQGRLVALVAHHDGPHMKPPERVEKDGQSAFVFEGKPYPIDQPGEFGLAHAYRREGDTWTHVETRVTDYGSDGAEKTRSLALAKTLGPTTDPTAKEGPRPESVTPEERTALDTSAEAELIGPRGEDLLEDSTWVRGRLPGGDLYYRAEPTEGPNASPPLRWKVDGTFVAPEKLALPIDASLVLEGRGDALLVTTGKAARLYDMKARKHRLALDGVSHVSFWPDPSNSDMGADMSTPGADPSSR